MFTWIKHYFFGMVRLRIEGQQKESFLELCRKNRIFFWNLKRKESAIEATLTLKDFWELRRLARRRMVRLRIVKKQGLPFFLHQHRRRKAFFVAFFVMMAFIYCMAFYLWDISFEGNSYYSDEVLLQFLNANGYTHGMKISKIVCDDIEKRIRNEYPSITWVSARIEGTRLVVAVKENYGALSMPDLRKEPCDIISDYAGTVISMVTRKGTPKIHIGDTVEVGSLLVSGEVSLLNDSKEVYDMFSVTADADIFIETDYNYHDQIDRVYSMKKYIKKQQGLYVSWNDQKKVVPGETSGDAMECLYDLHQLKLFQNWYFPFYFGTVTRKYYETVDVLRTDSELKEALSENMNVFLENLTEKGIQIVSKDVKIELNMSEGCMDGIITMIVPCGKSVPLQSAEQEGE